MNNELSPLILFGKKLIEIRKRYGLSQEKLAFESGLGRSYLGGVERGERNISLINIYRLSTTLKVKLSELMDF